MVFDLPDLVDRDYTRPRAIKDALLQLSPSLAKNDDLTYDCTVAVPAITLTLHSHTVVQDAVTAHHSLHRRLFSIDTVLSIHDLAALVDTYPPLW